MRTATAFLALLLFSGHANALGMCGDYRDFVAALQSRYGETSQGKGIAGEVALIELFTSPDTFTILATGSDGKACIIAAGKNWEAETKPLKPKEHDT